MAEPIVPKSFGPPLGMYSHGMIARGGELVVVAGQVGLTAEGRVPGDDVGSHSCLRASHSASLTTRPSGETRSSAQLPMARWKPRCGSFSSTSIPCFLITAFQRSTPRWQSAT